MTTHEQAVRLVALGDTIGAPVCEGDLCDLLPDESTVDLTRGAPATATDEDADYVTDGADIHGGGAAG